jgi:hypothetical protein
MFVKNKNSVVDRSTVLKLEEIYERAGVDQSVDNQIDHLVCS